MRVLPGLLCGTLGFSCRGRTLPPQAQVSVPEAQPPARVLVEPAGVIESGKFRDADAVFSISVPQGWRAIAGPGEARRRLSMRHGLTGAEVGVLQFCDGENPFVERPNCFWGFDDEGAYRDLPVAGLVRTGTCIPYEPSEARVIGWQVSRGPCSWLLELSLPQEQMIQARSAGLGVLRTARWVLDEQQSSVSEDAADGVP